MGVRRLIEICSGDQRGHFGTKVGVWQCRGVAWVAVGSGQWGYHSWVKVAGVGCQTMGGRGMDSANGGSQIN
jgi:hypothetical protein